MRCFYISAFSISQISCVVQRMKTITEMPLSIFHVSHRSVGESAFPDVFRDIVAKPHPSGLSINVKLLFLDCGDHNDVHLCCITRIVNLLPIVLNLLSGFNTTKSNQSRPLPSCEFHKASCLISCNSAVHFHCSVCTLHKNIFSCVTDNSAAAATTNPAFI